MNLVIDDAVEVKQATKSDEEKRRNLGQLFITSGVNYIAVALADMRATGQILLKGDNVSLIQALQ